MLIGNGNKNNNTMTDTFVGEITAIWRITDKELSIEISRDDTDEIKIIRIGLDELKKINKSAPKKEKIK